MQLLSLLCAALALATAMAAPAAEDAEIQTALEEDDSCPASGEEGARCALSALQLRAEKQAQEANSTGAQEEADACHQGLVGQIRGYAPGCFQACPQMCGPLGQAISAYMHHGGQPAVKPVVCGNKAAFGCAYSGSAWGSCSVLVHKAASFGFTLPSSYGGLNSECR